MGGSSPPFLFVYSMPNPPEMIFDPLRRSYECSLDMRGVCSPPKCHRAFCDVGCLFLYFWGTMWYLLDLADGRIWPKMIKMFFQSRNRLHLLLILEVVVVGMNYAVDAY